MNALTRQPETAGRPPEFTLLTAVFGRARPSRPNEDVAPLLDRTGVPGMTYRTFERAPPPVADPRSFDTARTSPVSAPWVDDVADPEAGGPIDDPRLPDDAVAADAGAVVPGPSPSAFAPHAAPTAPASHPTTAPVVSMAEPARPRGMRLSALFQSPNTTAIDPRRRSLREIFAADPGGPSSTARSG